jgi:PKD repeat protein
LQYKNKKNLYKIVFITILLGFIISLVGCNWLSLGLLNVFDPQAQIRLSYTKVDLENGSISLEIYSLNEVELIGSGFEYEYYNGSTKINSLDKMVGVTFYVEPSTSPGTPGPITKIDNMPLYFQEVLDYLTLNPLITEITCNISLVGTDGAGHSISETVTIDLPALQPGIDFVPPTAVINVTPGTTGTEPFTVIFDAYSSTDDRGIASYAWDFGDGTTATGVMPAAHTYTDPGEYIVKLTVTDYWGNVGIALVTITVGEAGAPTAVINVTPSQSGIAPFTVYFDASGSSVVSDCGSCSIVSYDWNFGDGTTGTGITIEHTYAAAGTYNVILTVTDSNGNTGYDSVTITVSEPGAPSEITVTATPTEVDPGGGDSAITANVKDAEGNAVTNGTIVTFGTTSGSLLATSVPTLGGFATTTLTLSSEGSATVTAVCGSVSDTVIVTCPPVPTP